MMKLVMTLALGTAGLAASVAVAGNAFRVTPYVQHPATTAMTLKFLTTENSKATVSWWPESDTGAKKSASVTMSG